MVTFDWFFIAFLIFAIGERIYERRYSNQAVRGERKMDWSYTALHSFHGVIFAAAATEHFLVRREVNLWVTAAGLVLFVIAMVVRLTAIRTLGRFWSLHLEIRQEHKLITEGIYQYMRHPAYCAIMVEVTSVPLVGNCFFSLVLAACVYIPLLLMRWHREEKEMIAKFGDDYVQYRDRVPAFIPWRMVLGTVRKNVPVNQEPK